MAQDIIDLLEQDHDEVEQLLARLEECRQEERGELFREIVRELARHEAAEEAIVHPAMRDEVPDGGAEVQSILEEESEAEQLLADMEGMDPEGSEFLRAFRSLRTEVLAHAEHEERSEFPALRKALSEAQRREMGERFATIKNKAPTHPHPRTPQTPEVRAAAGPVAGVFDRMRDTVRDLMAG